MLPTNPSTMPDIDDEFEQFEKKLTSFQKEFAPTAEFAARMKKRLQRHGVLMSEAAHEAGTRGFWMFLGTRTYATVTAFVFVLFTGGLSTFAYTNNTITNGNPLYPVKRGLEKIEQTFAGNTPEAHAEFQVKMLGRRLAESRNLTLAGVIDDSTTQEVSTVVDNGIQAIAAIEKNNYRDQLLDRVTTMLKNEERNIYETAGVPYPVETIAPAAVSAPAVSVPVVNTPAVIPQRPTPAVTAPSAKPDESADERTFPEPERVRAEKVAPELNDDTRSISTNAPAPQREDNIPTSLGAPSDMINALEKHSQNLRQIELRVTQVRRR